MNSLTNTSGAEAPDEIPIVLHLDIFSSGKENYKKMINSLR